MALSLERKCSTLSQELTTCKFLSNAEIQPQIKFQLNAHLKKIMEESLIEKLNETFLIKTNKGGQRKLNNATNIEE